MIKGLGESKDVYGLREETFNTICTPIFLCPYHEKRRKFNPIIPDSAPFERYEQYEATLSAAKAQNRELIGGWYIWKPHFEILQTAVQKAVGLGKRTVKIINVGIASGAAFEGLIRVFSSLPKDQVEIETCDPCVIPLTEVNQKYPSQYKIGVNLFCEPIETLSNRMQSCYDLALAHYTTSWISGVEQKKQFLRAMRTSLTENGEGLVVFTTNDKDFKTRDDFVRIATETGFKEIRLEDTTDPFDGPDLGIGKNFVAHLIK